MGLLHKTPFVSLLIALAVIAAPFVLERDRSTRTAEVRFENAREAARTYWRRNPVLEVDAIGERVLGRDWLEQTRTELAAAERARPVALPPRLLARSQARLDELLHDAFEARLRSDPAWRHGVLAARPEPASYVTHVFVHEAMAGIILCVVVLLLVAVPLELAWGSLVMLGFATLVIPATAQAYRILDAGSGIPWTGSAGLCGALVGAYFIRSLGGRFSLPGWLVLPAWLGAEIFGVRGFRFEDPSALPWATYCAAVGLGAAFAGLLRLLHVEAHRDEARARREPKGPHPVVARAARLRSDGDPYQAFDLIQAAWRDEPDDVDVREAFFSIAVEVGQPEAAAEAIAPSLRRALRKGEFARAVEIWLPLAVRECGLELEPTAFVRLAEILLDASHPEEALFSLHRAIEVGVSSAQATRIVNIARDLDADLARSAARIALADAALEPGLRAELQGIVDTAEGEPEPEPESAAPRVDASAAPGWSQLDRRVAAEHQTFETTAFPLAGDADRSVPGDDLEATLAAQALDAGALSAEALAAGPAPSADPTGSGDVLSHWGEAPLEEDPLGMDDFVLDEDGLDATLLDPGALAGEEAGLHEFGEDDLLDPREDETDSDFTPLMDATDELTSPLAGAAARVDMTPVFDQPTAFVPTADAGGSADPAAAVADEDEFAFAEAPVESASEPQAETVVQALRPLKAVTAVPTQATASWIEIDAEGRGKSRLPVDRIDAIALAAVGGLADRPVLILDLVLNWGAGASEPLKSIRLRSDRFDPMPFAPGAETPLMALVRWVGELAAASDATCLPTRDLLDGRFARFASLSDYDREVLLAEAIG